MNGRALFWLVCFIHLCHTWLAGVTSYTASCIFIHLRHRAALSQLHCAFNQKFGAPVRSTFLDDFENFVFKKNENKQKMAGLNSAIGPLNESRSASQYDLIGLVKLLTFCFRVSLRTIHDALPRYMR